MPNPYYRLRIKSLKFISAVDAGAQGPVANVALIKRAPEGAAVDATCRVVKVDEKLGLVFGWALATSLTGGATPHVDMQDDAIVGDDELIKVAAEFMEASAASDVLHDEKPDGKIVFAMPLTKEVNTALGIRSDVHGLAIAMRPSPATFKRFVTKELNAFSIGGLGERELVKGKRKPRPMRRYRYGKQTVLTSIEDGHQHGLDVREVCNRWYSGLTTNYATSEGAEEGHCHAWVFDPATGAITIAMDSGHTHSVDVAVPADVLSAFAEMQAKKPDDDAGCEPAPCEGGDGGAKVVVVAARAPAGGKSSPSAADGSVGSQEQEMATEQELQKRIAHLEKVATLTDAQRVHYGKLSGQAAETFLAKSSAERDQALAEIAKADEVVYTATDGSVFRKSDDPRLVSAVKRADESARDAALEKAARQQVELEKRAATELSHFAKSAGTRAAILRAIDGIADEAVRKEALESLKGANVALAKLAVPIGGDGGGDPQSKEPLQAWNDGLATFAKGKNIANPLDAIPAFLGTDEGKALKRAYDATRGYAMPHAPQN